MTVGVQGNLYGFKSSTSIGQMSGNTFTVGGTTFEVRALMHDDDVNVSSDSMYFELVATGGHATNLWNDYVLQLGSDIRLSSRDVPPHQFYYSRNDNPLTITSWLGTGQPEFSRRTSPVWDENEATWTDGQTVSVRLVANIRASGTPTISGHLREGHTLSVSPTGITDPDGIPANPAYSYSWDVNPNSDSRFFVEAEAQTFALTFGTEGQYVKGRVSFLDNDGATESVTAVEGPLGRSHSEPRNVVLTPLNGKVRATWDPPAIGTGRIDLYIMQVKLSSMEWSEISTADNYRLRIDDETTELVFTIVRGAFNNGAEYQFRIAADGGLSKIGDWSAAKSFNAPVNTPATGAPTIMGTETVGRLLTANTDGIMDADGIPSDVVFSYQWILVDGLVEADITAATGKSYVMTAADENKKLKVQVSFEDSLEFPESLTSAATSTIGQQPLFLVKNASQSETGDGSVATTTSVTRYAQAFSTGAADFGYDLTAISVAFAANPGNTVVTLNKANGANPGDALCTLAHPASYTADGLNTFPVPDSGTLCPVLDPGTTYFVVVARDSADATLYWTSSPDEDPTPAEGWTIANVYRYYNAGTSSWSRQLSRVLKIEVLGADAPAPVISYDRVKSPVTEGTDSAAQFTLTRTGSITSSLTVNLDINTGTADVFTDLAPGLFQHAATATFPAGQETMTLSYFIEDDNVDERTSRVAVKLLPGEGYTISSSDAGIRKTVEVSDDDVIELSVSVDTTSVEEGESVTFTFQSTNGVAFYQDLTMTVRADNDGQTAEDEDNPQFSYSGVTLPAGSTSASRSIGINEDQVVEGDETFRAIASYNLHLTPDPTESEDVTNEFIITIIDNDRPSWVVRSDRAAITERGTVSSATVTVSAGPVTFEDAQTISLAFTGTATKGTDYTVGAETLALAIGQSEVQTTVTAIDDTVSEGIETIDIALQVEGTTVATSRLNLLNGFGLPVNFGSATYSADEGGSVTLTLTLGAASTEPVTVPLTVTPGPGLKPNEWSGVPERVTFSPGETSVSITASFSDDQIDETDELLTLVIEAPLHEDYSPGNQSEAVITVADDDEIELLVSLDRTSVTEGGRIHLNFRSTNGVVHAEDILLRLRASQSGLTAEPQDYQPVSDITLVAGTEFASFRLQTVEDRVAEGDETFALTYTFFLLSQRNEETFIITIVDDDHPSWDLTVEPELIAEEGVTTSSTVRLATGGVTFPEARTIVLGFTGTATKGTDYTVGSQSLTLAVGSTSVQTTVTAQADTIEEATETIEVFAGVDGVPQAVDQATIRLLNGSGVAVSFGSGSLSAEEGGNVTVTVSLTEAPTAPVTIPLTATPDQSQGLQPDEYLGVPDGVTFNAGETSTSFVVTFPDDDVDELNERLTLEFGPSLPQGYVTGTPRRTTLTVVDNDVGPPAPRNFLSFWPTQTSITLRWTSLETGAEYRLEKRKEGENEWTRIGDSNDFDHLPSNTYNRRLTGVAAGLDCGALYHFRVSVRSDGSTRLDGGHYSAAAFGRHAEVSARTGECAQEERITNLLASIEPNCATLTWTAPTGDKDRGYRVERHTYLDNRSQALEPVTLRNETSRVATSYQDCSTEYRTPGSEHSYIVQALGENGRPFGGADTSILDYGPNGEPDEPRNVRFTRNDQSRRTLAWEPTPDPWLTTVKMARSGSQQQQPAADPWITGYRVERLEYSRDANGNRVEVGEWETVRQETNGSASTSYSDSANAGSKLYMYRVWSYNARGLAYYSWPGDWLFMDGRP